MAIASTGPLALKLTIRAEELIKSPSIPATDISTRNISDLAGFSEPDAFSEFYGYSSAILPTMASIRVSGGPNDSYIAFAATPATNGFVALTSRGFYFGTDYRGPQYNTRYQVDTSNSLGEFSKGFSGLAGSTTYYCWGYVQNQIGEAYTARSQGTTQRVIPIGTGQGSYLQLMGPKGMRDVQYFYTGIEGSDIYTFKQAAENSSAMSYFGCMYLDSNQQAYLDMAYLHPYYGWTSNGGVYANRYDNIQRCSYESNWNGPYGWGAENHTFYGSFTMKRADNAPTRQRNQMHIDNYFSRNGGYGGSIDYQHQGGWWRRNTSYFGGWNNWTSSGNGYFSSGGTSTYDGGNGTNGFYAPYYDAYHYSYTAFYMYGQYADWRYWTDHVGYFYSD